MSLDYRDVDLQSNPFLLALQGEMKESDSTATVSAASPSKSNLATQLQELYDIVGKMGGNILIPPIELIPVRIDLDFAKSHILIPHPKSNRDPPTAEPTEPTEQPNQHQPHTQDQTQSDSTAAAASTAAEPSPATSSDPDEDAASSSVTASRSKKVSHWLNMSGELFHITDGVIYADNNLTQPRARILLEELHYNDEFQSFHVLCIDDTIHGQHQGGKGKHSNGTQSRRASNTNGTRRASTSSSASSSSVSSQFHLTASFLTGSSIRPECRSLSHHRDILTHTLGEHVATKAIFASHGLDFFLTDFSLAWLQVVSRTPAKAADHLAKAAGRCLQESFHIIRENKKLVQQAQPPPTPTPSSHSSPNSSTVAPLKYFSSWPKELHLELELAIQCHIASCLHAKIFSTLQKVSTCKTSQDLLTKSVSSLGEVSLFDVGVSPHLVGQVDPRPAIEQLKLMPNFVTPIEKLACLQKVEMALMESIQQSIKQKSGMASTTTTTTTMTASPTNDSASTVTVSAITPSISSTSSSASSPSALPPPSVTSTPASSLTSSLSPSRLVSASGLVGGLTTPSTRARSVSFSRAHTMTAVEGSLARTEIGVGAGAAGIASPVLAGTESGALSIGHHGHPPAPSRTSPQAGVTPSGLNPALHSSTRPSSPGPSAMSHSSIAGISVASSLLAASVQQSASGLASTKRSTPNATADDTNASSPGEVPSRSTPNGVAHTAATAETHSRSSSPNNLHSNRSRQQSSFSSAVTLSADDLLPLLVYVVLQARPTAVYATIAYCRYFAPGPHLLTSTVHSELMYRLANFEAACEYIASGRLKEHMAAVAVAATMQANNPTGVASVGSAASRSSVSKRPRMASISVSSTQTLYQLLTPVSTHHKRMFKRNENEIYAPITNDLSAAFQYPKASKKTKSSTTSPSSSSNLSTVHADTTTESMPTLVESPPLDEVDSIPIGSLDSTIYADDVEGVDDELENDSPIEWTNGDRQNFRANMFSHHDDAGDDLDGHNGPASDGEIDFTSSSLFMRSSDRLPLPRYSTDSLGLSRPRYTQSLFAPLDMVHTSSEDPSTLPAWLTDEANEPKRSKSKRNTANASSDANGSATNSSMVQSDSTPNESSNGLSTPLVSLALVDEDDPLGALTKSKKKNGQPAIVNDIKLSPNE